MLRAVRSRVGLCEIAGVGPVPVELIAELEGNPFIKAVIRDGTDIRTICHFGRHVLAELRSALDARDPVCSVPAAIATGGSRSTTTSTTPTVAPPPGGTSTPVPVPPPTEDPRRLRAARPTPDTAGGSDPMAKSSAKTSDPDSLREQRRPSLPRGDAQRSGELEPEAAERTSAEQIRSDPELWHYIDGWPSPPMPA